jgi:DNA-3-methyladenine glycosylase
MTNNDILPIDHSAANSSQILTSEFFARSVYDVAPDLIGCYLFTTINGVRTGGMIIETEAYRKDDPFAHCFSDDRIEKPTHTSAMLAAPGSLYFYYSGQLPCLNVACEAEGVGSAVLIRALLPVCNPDVMIERRSSWYVETGRPLPKVLQDEASRARNLCNGPGVLCEALGIADTSIFSATTIFDPPFEVRSFTQRPIVASGIRIGLDAMYKRWRKNGDRRANLSAIDEYGSAKRRWVASEFGRYCRHSSTEQEWKRVASFDAA